MLTVEQLVEKYCKSGGLCPQIRTCFREIRANGETAPTDPNCLVSIALREQAQQAEQTSTTLPNTRSG